MKSANVPRWRRLLALSLVVAAVGVVVLRTRSSWPVEQQLVFEIASPQQVRSLAATWTREGEDEPRGGAQFSFAHGAPHRIERRLSLPKGDYVIDVRAIRTSGSTRSETSRSHRVALEGRQVVLFVDARVP